MMNWTVEYRNVSELKENPRNPRKIDKSMAQRLQESLDKFGQCDPIVINLDGEIIGGHQRFRLLRAKGVHHVLVTVPSSQLAKEEADELCLRLNKNTGYFDYDILANSWDLDLLIDCGFTNEDLHLAFSEEPEKVDQDQDYTFTINVSDLAHAELLEQTLTAMMCDYPGATWKKKKRKNQEDRKRK